MHPCGMWELQVKAGDRILTTIAGVPKDFSLAPSSSITFRYIRQLALSSCQAFFLNYDLPFFPPVSFRPPSPSMATFDHAKVQHFIGERSYTIYHSTLCALPSVICIGRSLFGLQCPPGSPRLKCGLLRLFCRRTRRPHPSCANFRLALNTSTLTLETTSILALPVTVPE